MAKTNSIKICKATVISKTLSGSDFIVSLQEDKGKVHTLYLDKEESLKVDLGEKIQITLEKAE
jgi:hypothetical protein